MSVLTHSQPPAVRWADRWALLPVCVASAILAALVIAAMEGLALYHSPHNRLEDPQSLGLFLAYTVGAMVLLAVGVGLLQGVVLGLYPAESGPRRLVGRMVRWLLGRDAAPGHGAARVVATTMVAGALMVGSGWLVWAMKGDPSRSSSAAATTVAAALLVAVPTLVAFHLGLTGLLTRLCDRWVAAGKAVPGSGTAAVGLVAMLLGAACGALWLYWDTVRLLDLRRLAFGLTFITGQVLAAHLLLTRGRSWSYGVSRTLVIATIVATQGGYHMLYNIDDHTDVKLTTVQETVLTGRVLAGAQGLLDADGDGHASLLGGGDCDDTDPTVHPSALDTPGNGLDEDCDGEDALIPPPPPAPPKPVPTRAGPTPGKRWNFIFLTVDALRWDHVGTYGHHRATTPNIDALAETSTVFERAYSQAPQTKASVPSMLTGRYFSEVSRSKHLWVRIDPSNIMFPEILREGGYHTAGIMAHPFFRPRHGVHKGFEHWDLSAVDAYGRKAGGVDLSSHVTSRAITHLKEREASEDPVFLWLHYYDPHHPYIQHPGVPRFGKKAVDLYDSEVANVDRHIGELLDYVKGSRWSEDTVIVFHSDHGEGFGEHGYVYHGIHIYEDQLRVPLVIHVPGQKASRVKAPAAILDLAPTVLEMAGLNPQRPQAGFSLVSYLFGDPPEKRPPVFSEMVKDARHSSRKVLVDWPWKLHQSVTYNYYELFNLEEDPGERRNRVKTDPKVFKRLKGTLQHWRRTQLQEIPAGFRPKKKKESPSARAEKRLNVKG